MWLSYAFLSYTKVESFVWTKGESTYTASYIGGGDNERKKIKRKKKKRKRKRKKNHISNSVFYI